MKNTISKNNIINIIFIFFVIILIIIVYSIRYQQKEKEALESPERYKIIEKIKDYQDYFLLKHVIYECQRMRKFPYNMYFDIKSCLKGEVGITDLEKYCEREQEEKGLFNTFYNKCVDVKIKESKK